jgi:hypothetical protein
MYAILLNEQQPLELEKTARILAKASGLLYGDATRAVRSCTGILARNLPYDEAGAIASELNANGVGCFVLAMADFYHPPDARPLLHLQLSPDAFGPTDMYGRVTPVPWPSIALLCVGHMAEERRERYTLGDQTPDETGITVGLSLGSPLGVAAFARRAAREEPEREIKTAAHLVLDVFAFAPTEGHWRIQHNGFNYSCLGPNRQQGSAENFRLLVGEIVRLATASYCNRALNAFLGDESERTYSYDTTRQFDEENLWLLQKVYPNWRSQ